MLGIKRTPHNTSTVVRELSVGIDEAVMAVLTSQASGEGVYGLEVVSGSGEEVDTIFVSPSFFREEVGQVVHRNHEYLQVNSERIHCYQVTLNKPSFLPIYTKTDSLIENLSLIKYRKTKIFVQFLFSKRTDRWKETAIDQYQEFLRGNEYPSPSAFGRLIQNRMLKVVNKISGFATERGQIEEVEEKILEDGYRFEMRIVVVSDEAGIIEDEIREVLKEHDYYNELVLVKRKKKKPFLDGFIARRFSEESELDILGERELLSLTGCESERELTAPPMKQAEDIKREVMKAPPGSKIGLLPIGKKKDRQVDDDIIAMIPEALKKAKAVKESKINIKEVELGATVQRITFEIPSGSVYSDIKKKGEDIKAIMGADISILPGHEPNTITFMIPCKERDVVHLRNLLESEEFVEFAKTNPLPFVCGIDLQNGLVLKCLTKAPHLLVAGATNSGKSVFVNSLLIALILMKSPDELRLFLIDPKMVEFLQYEGFAHIERIVTNPNESLSLLDGLVKEMDRRYEIFSQAGVKKIESYNDKTKEPMPYVVCAIDEYNDLRMVVPEVEERIERLGQKARAAGIHLVVATQRPDKEVMSGVIKSNLPSRISFQLNNSSEYRTVFGTGIPYKNLLGFGDGVVKYVAQTEEFIRFQAPVISLSENEEEETYEKIKQAYKGEKVEGVIDVTMPVAQTPMEKVKHIIATTGETRVRALQEELGIRTNVVSDILKALMEEGWLEKNGKSYEVIAPEEELQEWK